MARKNNKKEKKYYGDQYMKDAPNNEVGNICIFLYLIVFVFSDSAVKEIIT